MRIAIKVGGSLCMGPNGPDHLYMRKLLPVINELRKKHKVALAIGGGKFVSGYFKNLKVFGLTDNQIEWIAIELMRSNQMFLSYMLNGTPIYDMEKFSLKKLPILSGIVPKRSTDANAALAAEKMKADIFLVLTDVKGIYDKNPRKHRSARLLKNISFKEISKYAIKKTGPKHYGVVDPLAIKVIKRSKIRTIVFDGTDPRRIFRILKGDKVGTEIC